MHKDWKGKFQWDMGKTTGDNEVAIKDAYMQYKGFEDMKITVGNANFPFSREFLTSSKYQQLVERTFVGDHDYGTPDRNTGIHVEGGYMVLPETLEIVAGYQFQDADNYATQWTRASVGANWFIHKHDIKLQFTYRIGKDLKGVQGSDENEAFVQAQYVF